ncbi:MAG: hypothetical protein ACRDRP_07695 [Pseudonocardiaceae bacterium]
MYMIMDGATVLETPAFHDLIGLAERCGLSPLFWTHINPCRFRLDMNTRLDLTGTPSAATPTAG